MFHHRSYKCISRVILNCMQILCYSKPSNYIYKCVSDTKLSWLKPRSHTARVWTGLNAQTHTVQENLEVLFFAAIWFRTNHIDNINVRQNSSYVTLFGIDKTLTCCCDWQSNSAWHTWMQHSESAQLIATNLYLHVIQQVQWIQVNQSDPNLQSLPFLQLHQLNQLHHSSLHTVLQLLCC